MPSTPSAIQNKYFELTVLILLILCFFPGFLQFVLLLPTRVVLPFFSRPIIVPETPPSAPVYVLSPDNMSSSWFQKTIHLPPQSRGSYLVTDAVVSQLPELKSYRVGLLNLFVQHTSCALSLNENWDSDVRADMSDALDRLVPMDRKGNLYRHSAEGEDDMPVRPFFMFRPKVPCPLSPVAGGSNRSCIDLYTNDVVL